MVFEMPACVTSQNPLTDLGTGPIDFSVGGTWVLPFPDEEEDISYWLHIGVEESGTLHLIHVMSSRSDYSDEMGTLIYSGHSSFVDGNWYFNLLYEGGTCLSELLDSV